MPNEIQVPGLTTELAAKVLAAAGSDPKFYAAFVANPKAAYKERFGEDFLPGEPLQVLKMKSGEMALYLPNYKKGVVIPQQTELSDELLEKVAGGKGQASKGAEVGKDLGETAAHVAADFLF